MPGTARGLGVDPRNVQQNIQGGVHYLAEQLATYADRPNGERVVLALACYNAGPNAVKRAGHRVPAIAETQRYVRKVTTTFRELHEAACPDGSAELRRWAESPAGAHEGGEDRGEALVTRGQQFGVALQPQAEVSTLALEGLDNTVVAPRHGPEPRSGLLDRLVVEAVDRKALGPEDRPQAAILGERQVRGGGLELFYACFGSPRPGWARPASPAATTLSA